MPSSEIKNVSPQSALIALNRCLEAHIIKDVFQASSIYAALFQIDKNQALDMFTDYRILTKGL